MRKRQHKKNYRNSMRLYLIGDGDRLVGTLVGLPSNRLRRNKSYWMTFKPREQETYTIAAGEEINILFYDPKLLTHRKMYDKLLIHDKDQNLRGIMIYIRRI